MPGDINILDDEIIQLLRDNISEWYISYLVFKSLTGDEFCRVTGEPNKFTMQWQIDRRIYYRYKLGIQYYDIYASRASRTRIHLSISLPLEEEDIIDEIKQIINGYVDYELCQLPNCNYTASIFRISFTIDFGSKAYCEEFLNKIQAIGCV